MRVHIVVVLSMLLIFSGCSNEETIKIGVAASLSGDAASWGIDEVNTYNMVVDQLNAQGGINGVPVQLVVEDTQTSATGTLNALQKLVNVDGVEVILGPTWADSFGEITGSFTQDNEVVVVTPSAALEVVENLESYDYFYSTWFPQVPEAQAQIRYALDNGYTRISFIHDPDPFNKGYSQLVAEEAAKMGLEVVGDNEIPFDTTDFRTTLLKVQEQDADVVMLQMFAVEQIGSVVKQSRELGMTSLFMSTASAQTPDLIDSYDQQVEDAFVYSFPDTSTPNYETFIDEYSAVYGSEPTGASAATSNDAIAVVIAALESGATSGPEIKTFLDQASVSGTVVETLEFTELGQIGEAPFVIKEVRDGEFVIIE